MEFAHKEIAKIKRDLILAAINAGIQHKNKVYMPGARACYQFYCGEYKSLFRAEGNVSVVDNNFMTINTELANKPLRLPIFQMSDNVTAQFVQIYSPYLNQGEMIRMVRSTKPYAPPPAAYGLDSPQMQQFMMTNPNPQQTMQYQMQQQQAAQQQFIDSLQLEKEIQLRDCKSEMLQRLLNYFRTELNLRAERKRVIDESLIVGGGAYICELVTRPENNGKLIASSFISMADIVWDPDAARSKDCKWLAIQYRAPAWLVSRMFNIPVADLKRKQSSTVAQQLTEQNNRNSHNMNDEITFWKWWSRMGCGARLDPNQYTKGTKLAQLDEMLGDHCFLVVSDSCDYPLNFGPQVYQAALDIEAQNEQLQKQYMMAALQHERASQMALMTGYVPPPPPQEPQLQDSTLVLKAAATWPIPFYYDSDDPWPVTMLEYHHRPNSPYPIPHLEFCLSYIYFMTWVVCFVADKCYRSNRTIWVIDDTISEQLVKQIQSGEDEAIVSMQDSPTVKQFIQFVEAPEMRKSLLDVYAFFRDRFERASGQTDVMQGEMARASRSATEAQVISDASTLRPQSMAAEVYHVDTRVARKEAIASMQFLTSQDVIPVLGTAAGRIWDNLIASQDLSALMRETEYDVVASPGRVLDLNTRQDQAKVMAQLVLPLLVNIGQTTGLFGPANAVLREIAVANQIDESLLQVPNMPPPIEPEPDKEDKKEEGENE